MSQNLAKILNRTLCRIYQTQARNFSVPNVAKPVNENCRVISCKRSKYDHYSNTTYSNLEEVPLASKGWNHSKSVDDFFTIQPMPDELDQDSVLLSHLGINADIVQVLNDKGIQRATAFQAKAMPLLTFDHNHLMLAAETGCGKTLTYLIPIIQSLIGQKSTHLNSPKAVVIVPNRELAYQIGEVAQSLAEPLQINVKILVGGKTKRIMLNPEFADVDILVATPGALGKLSTVGIYKLNNVMFTVLDEADTLLDDSFVERLSTIIKRVSQSKIVLVSATLPKSLPDILKPIEANLQQVVSPRLHKPLLNVTQKFIRLNRAGKPARLLQITKSNKKPMIVFTNRNGTCNWLALFLRENGVTCANINGDMNYALRIGQWNSFIRGEAQILSATDVGSRGLDTTQVRHVVNYDFPLYAADYLHRVGRVGRLGCRDLCKVTNFISGPEEVGLVQQIELAIRRDRPLANVDGNITKIVQKKITRRMRESV